ncbi:ATP-dependent helicase rhp16 [Sesamum alatum]|uniref:ATP-dependent helicase rhp16 n=1 Tax=Sesamum alatum TaxID=300844 RepID=A0AAE2CX59_9LAMI|nr:ATP-dependent helicase rhp16 [Sesamum alatum]
MKLRSHAAGPSSSASCKGKKKLKYRESSDEDGCGVVSSDSDYIALSDEGEDLLNGLEDNRRGEAWDLNFALEAAVEIGDDDLLHNVPKRRKKNSSKNEGGRIHKVQDKQEEDMNGDIENEMYGNPVEFDFTEVSQKYEKKKKSKKKKRDTPVLMWEVLEQENERWVAENLELDMDLMNQNEMVAETVEPSDDLIIPLLRYQKEWLAWSLKQEESAVRGGILADEMGMGKTLQAIALVLLKRSISRGIGHQFPAASASFSKELPAIKGTLVICPLVAVMQWVSEIDRFTSKGSTKVLVYHGANRAKNHYQFSEYDFVITTYSIVEAEYRKYVMPPKDKCQYCGKLFYEHKLKIHLKYICGPGAVKTAKQSKQQRKEQKPKKVSDFEVSTSTGRNEGKKHDNGNEEMENDYSIEDSAAVGRLSSAGKSILHSVTWERIILDEAHYIKDRRSNTTRAVLALQSSYKWALSGTPLQNRVGELYSLVRFLQIVPYSYYFCKDCDCRTLDYSTSAECPGCSHKNVRHFCWWNKYISSPIQDFGNTGCGRDAMLLLKHKILKSIVLRRTKKGRAADLALPPRIVTLRRDALDVVEEDYYTALYNESQAQFNTYIEAGTVLNNYAHIFDLLTRLRQAVDHPYLVEYSLTAMERKGKTVDTTNDEKCCLCNDNEEDTVVTSCGHIFCKPCLIDFGATMGQNSCPSCSKPLTVDFTATKDGKQQNSKTTIKGFRPSSILNRIRLDDFQTSTKIDALREEIRFMVERDGSAKGIVFSQFSSFLDLIHYALQKSGVNCVQLDGSMSMGARDTAIKRFTEDPNCRIFLMSLKAGGVALNLTVASHVFLMDPWWNPAVERQAQDRIHRIGQYKPIRITRFIIENTIEERILKLQEKKELVFEGTVGGSSEALAKLTEADLKFLFVT